MKHLSLLITFFIGYSFCLKAQSTEITASVAKSIQQTNGKWEPWPKNWSELPMEYPQYTFRIGKVDETAGTYLFALVETGLQVYVTYDEEHTNNAREVSGIMNMYCYKLQNGDYIYTENTSLPALLEDSSEWLMNEEAYLHLWLYSKGLAFVFKY